MQAGLGTPSCEKHEIMACRETRTATSRGTCSWEEVAILVERYSHHSVGQVKGLFHAIAMVNVNVHIQHSACVLCNHHPGVIQRTQSSWRVQAAVVPHIGLHSFCRAHAVDKV